MDKVSDIMAGVITTAVAGTRDWWKRNPEDYEDSEGVLKCGKCNQAKQYKMMLSAPTTDNPDAKEELVVPCACKCEMEKYHQEKLAEKLEKLKSQSGIGIKYPDAAFESYTATKHNERNLKYAKHYAECFEKMRAKNQGLLFWGNVGTGKSYTAACIANYLIEHNYTVVFTSFVEILKNVGNGFGYEEYMDKLMGVDLLILDDLGAERDTSYAKENVYYVVNSRYNRKLPMVFTTNLTLEEMQEQITTENNRVYDRILGCCYPMQFTGPSWRMKSAYERFNEMEKLFNE